MNLGYKGEEVTPPFDKDPHNSKIGGLPILLEQNTNFKIPKCENCQKLMTLIVQLDVPLPTQLELHRIILAFCCTNVILKCASNPIGWKVFRSQRKKTEKEIEEIKEYQEIEKEKEIKKEEEIKKEKKEENKKEKEEKKEEKFDLNIDDNDLLSLLEQRDQNNINQNNEKNRNQNIQNNVNQKSEKNKKNKKKNNQNDINQNKNNNKKNQNQNFKPYYIEFDFEPDIESLMQKEKNLLNKRYENYKQTKQKIQDEKWKDETFETDKDKKFLKFQQRISYAPEQILRYEFGGKELWISTPPTTPVPKCPFCNSKRIFEFQILPTIIFSSLKNEKNTPNNQNDFLDFGSIYVYSCEKSCHETSQFEVNYKEEFTIIQY